MKKSDKWISLMIAMILAIGLSGAVDAQTKEEKDAMLTRHHQNIMKHAMSIASGEAKTIDDKIKHAKEATIELENAKILHEEMKKEKHEKSRAAREIHHEEIKRLHHYAAIEAKELREELNKQKPNKDKIIEHARKLHDNIEKAEKEHKALKEITK